MSHRLWYLATIASIFGHVEGGRLSRWLRRLAAISMIAAALSASCCGERSEDALSCRDSADCERFGVGGACKEGTCSSWGISCAEAAGLRPGGSSGLAGMTNAAALEEWSQNALQVMGKWCTRSAECGGPGNEAVCVDSIPPVVDGTCCEAMLDLYVANRDAIKSCPASVPCAELSWETHCPALADLSFEGICG